MQKILFLILIIGFPTKNAISQSGSRSLKIEKSFSAGLNISNYVFRCSLGDYDFLSKADPKKSATVNFGFNVELFNLQMSSRFALKSGLTYFMIKQEYTYIDRDRPGSTEIYDVSLKNHYLKIPFLINCNLGMGSTVPFVFIGTHTNIAFKKFNHVVETTLSQTDTTVIERPAIPGQSINDASWDYEFLGLSLGGGLKYIGRKMPGYYFEIKYDRIQSLRKATNLDKISQSLFLTLGVIF